METPIGFDTVKPTTLIKKLLSYLGDDCIVLDFFSGSSTTAHAVMKLNVEDNGNRKFLMIQIPEKCDEKSDAFKANYNNICEIGEERIRRAGEIVKQEWLKQNSEEGLFSNEKKTFLLTLDLRFLN